MTKEEALQELREGRDIVNLEFAKEIVETLELKFPDGAIEEIRDLKSQGALVIGNKNDYGVSIDNLACLLAKQVDSKWKEPHSPYIGRVQQQIGLLVRQ